MLYSLAMVESVLDLFSDIKTATFLCSLIIVLFFFLLITTPYVNAEHLNYIVSLFPKTVPEKFEYTPFLVGVILLFVSVVFVLFQSRTR